MIIQGSLPELEQIFEKIQEANPSLEYMQKHHADNDYDSDSDDDDRMMGLPGIRGEAKLMMLNDDLLKMIEKQNGNDPEVPRPDDDDGDDDEADDDDDVDDDEAADDSDAEDDVPEPMEMDDDEYEAEQAKLQHELERMDEDDSHDEKEEKEEPVKRQTFVFSATLTLPSSSHHSIDTSQSTKGEKGKGKDKGQFGKISVDGAMSIAEILEKVGAQGQVKPRSWTCLLRVQPFRQSSPMQRRETRTPNRKQFLPLSLPSNSHLDFHSMNCNVRKCTKIPICIHFLQRPNKVHQARVLSFAIPLVPSRE